MFLSRPNLNRLLYKIKNNKNINLVKDMLPKFARNMVGKYTVYRGLNCFHAALSFQDINMPKSSFINLKQEKGHHRDMINNDELARILRSYFYEINPRNDQLHFGDIIIFFDLPKKNNLIHKTYFRWIKHASIYLFDNFSFSKASKEPESAYTVKKLNEEWNFWNKKIDNMGIKIYRSISFNSSTESNRMISDWLY